MNLDEIADNYVTQGGTYVATFLRGFSDGGRLGLHGELAGIDPQDQERREAYYKGALAASEWNSRPFPE